MLANGVVVFSGVRQQHLGLRQVGLQKLLLKL